MSILSLIKEKPQKKFERLFQITGVLSILVLIISILGICFTMFYHWYTPWHSEIDHLISWPEILGMAGLMWSFFVDLIYIYIINIIQNSSGHYFTFRESWPFLSISILFHFICFILLFFSIKYIITKRYNELTKLTKILISVFIILFILNFFTLIMTLKIK
jgi:membrane protein YdbS with pleckstrin-like domain